MAKLIIYMTCLIVISASLLCQAEFDKASDSDELSESNVNEVMKASEKHINELRKELQEQLEFLEKYEEMSEPTSFVRSQKPRNKRPSIVRVRDLLKQSNTNRG